MLPRKPSEADGLALLSSLVPKGRFSNPPRVRQCIQGCLAPYHPVFALKTPTPSLFAFAAMYGVRCCTLSTKLVEAANASLASAGIHR